MVKLVPISMNPLPEALMHAARFLSLIAVALTAGTSTALADGFVVQTSAAVEPVSVGAQRAAIILHPDSWEIMIEPQFTWGGEEAAWIIPLPAVPEVRLEKPLLLRDLDDYTRPRFVPVHTLIRCECFECECGYLTGGSGDSGDPVTAPVTVWESGTWAGVDWVLVSASAGESLSAWLDANGFLVPPAAQEVLAELQGEGAVFFAARLNGHASGIPLPVVRFGFHNEISPFYPVRLTAAGIPGDGFLDLLLWVVSEVEASLAPANVEWKRLDQVYLQDFHGADFLFGAGVPDGQESSEYDSAVSACFAGSPSGVFVSEYAGVLADSPFFTHEEFICNPINGVDHYFHAYANLLIPFQQTKEEIIATKAHVARFRARLYPAGMLADVTFAPVEQAALDFLPAYCIPKGMVHKECEPPYWCDEPDAANPDVPGLESQPEPAEFESLTPDSKPSDASEVLNADPATGSPGSGCAMTSPSSGVAGGPIWILLGFAAGAILSMLRSRTRIAPLWRRFARANPSTAPLRPERRPSARPARTRAAGRPARTA
jgi:hypothetical protein